MFRTRDFVLLFTVIVFLVAAIGVTVFDQWRDRTARFGDDPSGRTTGVASSSDLFFTAEVPRDDETARIQRLNRMREKIAQADLPTDTPAETINTVGATDAATEASSTENTAETPNGLVSCNNYAPYLGFWDSRGVTVTKREGATVVERTAEAGITVVLQLPARLLPAATPSCIASDVIGIANDGSLIRNDEVSLYGVFGSETQIGHALDGFPIYGVSSVRSDVCGGRLVAGQYRYELRADRSTVLNCFSATPVNLP